MIETAIFTSPDGNGTRWRLLRASDSARSRHHVRLKFDVAGGRIIGALICGGADDEVPLEDIRFDGMRLSFRLPRRFLPRDVPDAAHMLALTLAGDRQFRGYWVDDSGGRVDPDCEMKLAKVEDEVASL